MAWQSALAIFSIYFWCMKYDYHEHIKYLLHIFAYKLFCSRIDIVNERQPESSAITNQREIDNSLEHNVFFCFFIFARIHSHSTQCPYS